MAASARIDELRSKFDDNPRRYFAPLANEYRKAGDLETAIAICRTQLRHFPTHMSGHVVLGQALFEVGQLAEARTVLARAVELDPENVIALRHLGDIADATGDVDDARLWYRRLLDADPYNEQIVARLEALGEPPAPPAVEATRSDHHWRDFAIAPEVSSSVADARFEAASPAEVEFVDLAGDDLAWPTASELTALPTQELPAASVSDAEPLFIDGWEPLEPPVESQEREPTGGHDIIEAASDVIDPVVGLDVAPSPDTAVEQLWHVVDTPPAGSPIAPAIAPPAGSAESIWPSDDAQPLDEVVSGAFVTETMAELCLRQGHEDQALAIYDQLVAQRPDDHELAGRAQALRDRLAGGGASAPPADVPTAGAFLDDLAQRRPDGVEPPPAPAPITTSAETIEMEPLPAHERMMPAPDSDDTDWLDDLDLEVGEAEATTVQPPSGVEPSDGHTGAGWAGDDVKAGDAPRTSTTARSFQPSPRESWAANAWSDAFRPAPPTGSSILAEMTVGSSAAALAAAEPAEHPVSLDDGAAPDESAPEEPIPDDDADLSFDRFFVGEEEDATGALADPGVPVWSEATPSEATPIAATATPAAAATERAETRDAVLSAVEPVVEESDDDLAAFNAWLRGLRD